MNSLSSANNPFKHKGDQRVACRSHNTPKKRLILFKLFLFTFYSPAVSDLFTTVLIKHTTLKLLVLSTLSFFFYLSCFLLLLLFLSTFLPSFLSLLIPFVVSCGSLRSLLSQRCFRVPGLESFLFFFVDRINASQRRHKLYS